MVALWCALPALAIILVWKLVEPAAVGSLLTDSIPASVHQAGDKTVELYRNDLGNIVSNDRIATVADPEKQLAAQHLADLKRISSYALVVLALTAACIGAALALAYCFGLSHRLCIAGDTVHGRHCVFRVFRSHALL